MIDYTLIQFKGIWYRWHPREDDWYRNTIIQYFEKVIDCYDGRYEVIKDRHNGVCGVIPNIDLIKMKLWANGNTVMDLPTFTSQCNQRAPAYLLITDEGNLVDKPMLV